MNKQNGMMKRLTQLGLLLVLGASITGCATTVGQEFRDIMADIDAQCKRDHQGPYYDRTIPNNTQHSGCDILSIKPADPLATEEGRFAYSIKLPAPHDKLKTEYSRMMSAESYFKQLCEKDAGEWIFRTVEGVEGVFQGRRMEPFSAGYSSLIFYTHEVSEVSSEEPELGMVQPFAGRYNFFEIPSRGDKKLGSGYSRFYRGEPTDSKYGKDYPAFQNGRMVRIPFIVHSEPTDRPKSRYGYTWRQISNSDMQENGITGGETIIYDRTTNEVLAFRRFFGRVWPRSDSKGSRLTNGDYCQPGFTKGLHVFIQKVLVPVNPAE